MMQEALKIALGISIGFLFICFKCVVLFYFFAMLFYINDKFKE